MLRSTRNEILRDVKIKSTDFTDYLDTMLESGMVETKIVKRSGKGRDSLWVVLAPKTNVGNIANIANIAIIANIEEIPSDEDKSKDSMLAMLATKAMLPIVDTKGEEPQGIGPNPRKEVSTPAKKKPDTAAPESVLILKDYRTQISSPDNPTIFKDHLYLAGETATFPHWQAVDLVKRGVGQIVEAPA